MRIVGVIPARMQSGRFPGKPLALIHGIPMVGHVFLRSRLSSVLDGTYVATPDDAIVEYVRSIGGRAIMTSPHHQMCTDRVAEAALAIERELDTPPEIVVNIQGDQPMVFPEMIDATVAALLEDPGEVCATMVEEIQSQSEFEDPNRVKVVMDLRDHALYFSREPIPSHRKFHGSTRRYKHVAIIAFRRDYLLEFAAQPMTPLERVESVDYLRVIEHGRPLKVVVTARKTETVDTPEDLRTVERLMADDPLMPVYASIPTP